MFWPVDVIPSLNWDDDDDGDDDACIVAESEEGEQKDTGTYRMKRRMKQGGWKRSDSREGQSSGRIHPPQKSTIESLICCLQLSGCHDKM